MNRIEVGPYVLFEQLPGSRSTFLAARAGDEVKYVVKTVVGDFQNERIEESAKWLGQRLDASPHVCSIVEVGLLPHLAYAVAPHLDGMNLSRVIRLVHERDSAALTPRGAYGASFLISELALAYQELVSSWSDGEPLKFSPDSAFVCRDGSVCILDPRWIDLRHVFQQPPSSRPLAHDLAYYVPQYHRASLERKNEPVWGLSVVLWELLTGYRLFRRQSLVDTLHALTKAEIVDPRELNLSVPDKLARWLTETLRHPERRSLESFAEELTEVGHGSSLGGSLALEEWMMDLEGMKAEWPDERSEGCLEAFLEGDSVMWSSAEGSTTYTSGPPSIPDVDPEELVWLEDDTPRSVLPVVSEELSPDDEPTKPFLRTMFGVATLLLGLWGLNEIVSPSVQAPHSDGVEEGSLAASSPSVPSGGAETPESTENLAERVIEIPEILLESAVPKQVEVRGSTSVPVSVPVAPDKAPRPMLSSSDERSKSGILSIVAPAEVTTFIGQRVLGSGTVETRLPVGKETVRFSWPGSEEHEVSVRIKPGALTQMVITPDL